MEALGSFTRELFFKKKYQLTPTILIRKWLVHFFFGTACMRLNYPCEFNKVNISLQFLRVKILLFEFRPNDSDVLYDAVVISRLLYTFFLLLHVRGVHPWGKFISLELWAKKIYTSYREISSRVWVRWDFFAVSFSGQILPFSEPRNFRTKYCAALFLWIFSRKKFTPRGAELNMLDLYRRDIARGVFVKNNKKGRI